MEMKILNVEELLEQLGVEAVVAGPEPESFDERLERVRAASEFAGVNVWADLAEELRKIGYRLTALARAEASDLLGFRAEDGNMYTNADESLVWHFGTCGYVIVFTDSGKCYLGGVVAL